MLKSEVKKYAMRIVIHGVTICLAVVSGKFVPVLFQTPRQGNRVIAPTILILGTGWR
jgi:hypothetical protein